MSRLTPCTTPQIQPSQTVAPPPASNPVMYARATTSFLNGSPDRIKTCHIERSKRPASRWRHPYSSPRFSLLLTVAFLLLPTLHAQTSQPQAQQAIEAAVHSELAAAKADHSNWRYRDNDIGPDKNATYDSIETPQGSLRRMIELNGQPLIGQARNEETDRIAEYVNDPSEQAKRHKAGAHDDAQAEAMLKMLPTAFLWTIASDTPEYLTLDYRPNPAFNPPDYEARVMGTMAGQVIIARDGNRIRTLRGSLTEDVKFGFGLFGRLNQGGTFDIERRQIIPGHWQITESHVHIGGRALLFKNIGQQDDEVKTDWHPSTAHTLHEAEDLLRDSK